MIILLIFSQNVMIFGLAIDLYIDQYNLLLSS